MRSQGFGTLLLAFVALVQIAPGLAHAQSSFRIVARAGEHPAGAPEGYVFSGTWRETPKINNSGRVLFSATLERPADQDTLTSLWVADGTSLTPVAIGRWDAPGTPQPGTFLGMREFSLAGDGAVGFLSSVSGLQSLTTGVWFGQPGALRLAALENTNIPGTDGETHYNSLRAYIPWVQVGSADHVVFSGQFKRESEPSSPNNDGVYYGSAAGTSIVAMYGDAPTDISENASFAGLGLVGIASDGRVTYNGVLSGAGITPETDQGIWLHENGLSRLLLRSGGDVPGTADGVFHDLRAIRPMDEQGRLLIFGRMTPSGADSRTDTGYWYGAADDLRPVVREGDLAPGLAEGTRFTDFESASRQFHYWPGVSANGNVAFVASLRDGDANVTNDRSVWTWIDGVLSLVAREASPAPGMPDGTTFVDFNGPLINARDQVLFSASASVPGVFRPVTGIWATDEFGTLKLIARVDGEILLPGGETVTVAGVGFPGPTTTLGAMPQGFNDRGEIAFYATFTDAPPAVLVSTLVAVAEPGASTLAIAALLGGFFAATIRRKAAVGGTAT